MADIVLYDQSNLESLLKAQKLSDEVIGDIIRRGNPRPNNEATIVMNRNGVEPVINIARTGDPIYLSNFGNDDSPDFKLIFKTALQEVPRDIEAKVPPRNS